MQRKTVTELNRIKADVFETREELHTCSDELEGLIFEMTNVKTLDDIRTDPDSYYRDLQRDAEKARLRLGRLMKAHTAAVNKYREFFVC